MRLLNIIFLIIWYFVGYGQEQINVFGYILDDETGNGISDAHIKISGKETGATSGKNGFFHLPVQSFPFEIEISHINYHSQKMQIQSFEKAGIKIFLIGKKYEIPEALVTIPGPENITAGKMYDVQDYEIIDSNIIMLAYCYKQKTNPWLILMNPSGDTLMTSYFPATGYFFRDCKDQIYLVSRDSILQIKIVDHEFCWKNVNPDHFKQNILPCVAFLNETFYTREYFYDDQLLVYYYQNIEDSTFKEFRVIADFPGLRMYIDKNRFAAMGQKPPTEADIRFEEMMMFVPVFAPLVKIKNELYLFNYPDSVIEIYNKYSKLTATIPLKFLNSFKLKDEIFIDKISGRTFALFKKNGISTLREINLSTGELINTYSIPEFVFIEKIMINNNSVFFLYRKNNLNDFMKLYRLKI